jgi:hypothetical protein
LKVVVIGHQGEGVNVHALLACTIADDPEEDMVVVVLIEDRHAVDASVHDVHAQTLDVDTKWTRHAGNPSKRRSNRRHAKMKAFLKECAKTLQNLRFPGPA